jgi:hypothetical protein
VDRLSQILWRERELLELLSFKLEVERLLLSSGRTRWLNQATREIEDVLSTMRESELMRAVAADAAADELGLEPNPSLAALADAAPEPWKAILLEHRDALVTIAREIADLSEENQDLLSAGYRAAQETLNALGGGMTEGYTPAGAAVVGGARTRLFDKAL